MLLSKQKIFDSSPLGETSIDTFLNQYWQKKPLLIRNAFPDLQSPISADELAGLACEEHVNARLALEKSNNKHWQIEFGPFHENRFSSLPETGWSLLVSDVEKHYPDTKFLLNAFRFIADWRIDDLMVSYAPPGSSVGAHSDAYDVFLIQLSGERLWKISENYSDETLCNTDLPILKNFSAEQEWYLKAGDMLYLPPNVAHHGIAQASTNSNGEEQHCMTASVGFRAPSVSTMVNDYVHYVHENTIATDTRYQDSTVRIPSHHAEITNETVEQFIHYLKQGLTLEHEQVRQWLGHYCSDNKAFEDITLDAFSPQYESLPLLTEDHSFTQSPYSHFLFSNNETNTFLFVDGISYKVSNIFAQTLCENDQIDILTLKNHISNSDKNVLLTLINNGSIILT